MLDDVVDALVVIVVVAIIFPIENYFVSTPEQTCLPGVMCHSNCGI